MRCGEKRFVVAVEESGLVREEEVRARTPQEARKFARMECKDGAKVIGVRQKVRKQNE